MQRADAEQVAPPFTPRALPALPSQFSVPLRFVLAGRVETAESSLSFRTVGNSAHYAE
jgi:hypothetical protein